MKFIYTDSITSITSSGGSLGGDYTVSSVQNDSPKQPYIADSTSVTLTVSCAGAEAFYIAALAEDIIITEKSGANATLATHTIDNTSNFNLSEGYLYQTRTHLFDGKFITLNASTQTVTVALSSTTNYLNGISDYVSGNDGNKGQLTDGSTGQLFLNHPQLRLGTFINGSTIKINRLTGDGSGTTDVQLSTSAGAADFTVTSINLPIQVNTIRAGKLFTSYNPKVGLSETQNHFDIVQDRYSNIRRRAAEVRRNYNGGFQILESDRELFFRIFSGLRTQPIAAQIIDEHDRTAVFGYFPQPPQLNYSTQGMQIFDASFNFVELI